MEKIRPKITSGSNNNMLIRKNSLNVVVKKVCILTSVIISDNSITYLYVGCVKKQKYVVIICDLIKNF